MDLTEARRNLESSLDEEQTQTYFSLLRQCYHFKSPLHYQEFDRKARTLLSTDEQLRCHSYFIAALKSKRNSKDLKTPRLNVNKAILENVEFLDYVSAASDLPADAENRLAGTELFLPDSSFLASRIALTLFQNQLNDADNRVTDLMVHACHVFVKNIVMAMISKVKPYKIRNGNFQYGFNMPVADPFIRNYMNVIDDTQESKVTLEEDNLVPEYRPSLEVAEQQVAFARACSTHRQSDNVLSVRVLYETLKENPRLLALHSMQSVALMKLSLMLND